MRSCILGTKVKLELFAQLTVAMDVDVVVGASTSVTFTSIEASSHPFLLHTRYSHRSIPMKSSCGIYVILTASLSIVHVPLLALEVISSLQIRYWSLRPR